ncbi:transcriptional regulator [Acinetobacter sp. V102_4]|uniref:helix-turn-helix transcriptional regulator n=1 Tax=Acinetobacter sp. V102_4 TaxID=3072984 RepID=UPI00287EB86E|nr:transcriptional regulator [Acinetobacter sp. V102_4]MDS7929266.1 transcriptional regulator [Acinetobacter sp. V102_4]
MSGFNKIDPIRVSLPRACELLDVTRETLRHTIRKDPTFPKPIKMGTTKQAPVFFDYKELVDWHNSKKVEQDKEPSHG